MSAPEKNKVNKQKFTLSEILKHYGVRRAMIFVLLALFFSVLILIHNYFLNIYAKRSIHESGQLNAVEPAEETEVYLATGNDIINLTAQNVQYRLENGASDDEVLAYLTEETNMVMMSILPETTGLYGCINGIYMDGSGWDPGEDYVSEERPWYREAVDESGDVALVNPYLDLYSGEIIMTLSKALPDGKNVVAVDITLGHIQDIILKNRGKDDDTIRMIISNNGVVVGHTDPKELGKNYYEVTTTLGGEALRRFREKTANGTQIDDEYYSDEFSYGGDNYITYVVPIKNGWYSMSVAKSSRLFRPIYIMLTVSIASIVFTFITFTVIMIRTSKREIVAYKLQSMLTSSADVYMSVCDLDLDNNTVVEVKNVNPVIRKAVGSCDHNMRELFMRIMQNLPDSPTKQAAIDFTDLSTIDERMKDKDFDTIEYLSYGDLWVRARLVVSERKPDGSVSHVLWMLENIDREKKEREKLVDISEKAVAANEAKSAFLSNMSHEIRTPINAVLGMNEMVLRECTDKNIITYSQNIKSAGNSLLGLINDILDFSKIESGKMEIIPVDYDLASVINDLVNMIRIRAEAKNLQLKLDFDRRIPEQLHGDDVRIKQVITNILTNAVKYTEEGSVTFSIGYTKMEDKDDSILLNVSVTDTGMGIKEEDLNKLFAEFERIEEEKNRSVEGTGLGMSITKSLLSMMGSSLKVKSEYGKGSTFSFSLEQQVVRWEPIGDYRTAYEQYAKTQKAYKQSFTAPDARVLLVDDNNMNLLVFTGLLKKTEVKIDTALSGDDGIALALKNKYDIIFLDHMMPNKDGVETLKELQAEKININKDTPVICLTANAISGAREYYVEMGFDDYLTKPIDSKKLEEMICTYLPSSKLHSPEGIEVPRSQSSEILPDFVYHIVELDTMAGLKQCSTERIYRKALESYAQTIEDKIATTENYRSSDDLSDVMINISAIKYSAEMIGAQWIRKMAEDIEKTGADLSSEELDVKMNELFERCRGLKELLMPLCS